MKTKLPVIVALCALFVLIFASGQVIGSAAYGLRLCWELILPSLFPFFVVSTLLGKLGFAPMAGRRLAPLARRLFRVSGAGATALLVGLTGGYPLGAAYLEQLERDGQVPTNEAGRLLGFCNNSGPAFLVGAIGAGVFDSTRVGLLLYLSHALAALGTGLLLRSRSSALPEESKSPAAPQPFSVAFAEAVRQAVLAALNVCGFVVCFTVFTGLLDSSGFLPAAAELLSRSTGLEPQACRALLTGFWELGGGVGALQGLPINPGNLALAAGLVGWGGISVHFQTLSVLADSPVPSTRHLVGRLLSATLGAFLAFVLGQLLL